MTEERHTTVVVQQYLDELAAAQGDSQVEPVVRDLLGRAATRLQFLCATLLHRRYPRLARPPLNLQTDELLSALVERLLKAMRDLRPENVRQFFAFASQHIRWELNDLARRLDERTPTYPLPEGALPAPESTDSELNPNARRILDAIENLPGPERETFSLVRIQGITQIEAAELLRVSPKTIQRRLNRSLLLLTEALSDLQ